MAEHHGAPGHFGRASRMIFHRPTHRPPSGSSATAAVDMWTDALEVAAGAKMGT